MRAVNIYGVLYMYTFEHIHLFRSIDFHENAVLCSTETQSKLPFENVERGVYTYPKAAPGLLHSVNVSHACIRPCTRLTFPFA